MYTLLGARAHITTLWLGAKFIVPADCFCIVYVLHCRAWRLCHSFYAMFFFVQTLLWIRQCRIDTSKAGKDELLWAKCRLCNRTLLRLNQLLGRYRKVSMPILSIVSVSYRNYSDSIGIGSNIEPKYRSNALVVAQHIKMRLVTTQVQCCLIY